MDQVDDWYQQQSPQPPTQYIPSPALIQRKRVLSQITERSGEDSVSASEKASEKDAASGTSSAREDYRSGSSSTGNLEHTQQTSKVNANGKGMERVNPPDYEGRDYYAPAHEPQLLDGNIYVTTSVEVSESPVKVSPQQAKVYETSQDGSSGSFTKKSSPLRDVEGLRAMGDPWLSGSPARR
jgi:hypothetical protein